MKEIEIISDPEEIVKFLPLGVSIPIWPEFIKYITFDLKHFNAQSLLVRENGNIVGHTLIFYADKKTLYFGFFGSPNDAQEQIEFLVESLVDYARKNGFEVLKGPVNIPTIIYGWGFMEKGSSTSNFIHKPVNNPVYPDVFRQMGFTEILKEHSFEGTFDYESSDYTEGNTFDDYEIVVFDKWEEILKIKVDFLKLNVKNLPPESVVTPSSAGVFDNYFEFIKQYGHPWMMVFARYKKTKKIVGCFVGTPNPFDKKSIVLYTIVLDKKHRNKGLGWLMVKELFANSLKHGINYCTTFVGTHVSSSREMSKKLGLPLLRTHTVFLYSLRNDV